MNMTEATEAPIKRGPGRPPLRAEPRTSLRDRLRANAPTILEGDGSDKFAVIGLDRHPGVSVQFKRYSIKGEHDPYHISQHRRNGWEPMQAEDFPEMAARDENGQIIPGSIIKEGMILMGRPKELTDQAEAALAAAARKQIHDQKVHVGLAPAGTLPRTGKDLNGQRLGVDTEVLRQVTVED
jgi:hypothetical protein